ncbi:THUMP domain-containing class I SAM-dependent RNA methyltransferase [Clostridium oryzae]|uniref:Ribosomal RNA large subunit methyltransferase K/L n=1 Tax=Clostridium oryzae TaxID=1450648 RepID=A0A1V4ITX3_9CLOT|nr:class I SAM-dependent RNA methyltransferase [Clostridium oryzae]OPJ63224.1 ribosomal RNA large subunit methyltransferase K/L [Clostridium oryzae]
MKYDLIATTTFGIEAVTAKELKKLGYDNLTVENGSVTFQGTDIDIARANMWLRTADRVYIKIAEFKAETFEELFQGTKAINWGDFIPVDGNIHVVGKSVRSTLFSVSDCQAIVKKAIVESMKRKYKKDWFSEEGPEYKVQVALLKDIVTLSIDTTGAGLHKRGYREYAGEAPIKETLAAAMILISGWEAEKQLADPFCGSGTIPIEAALIGKNIAPGLNRDFIAEQWQNIDSKVWSQARREAQKAIKDIDFRILASDIDGDVLRTARQNAEKAGVKDLIAFQKLPMEQFSSHKKYGYMISNPPYGERLGEEKVVQQLYREIGRLYRELDHWKFFILTSHPYFEKLFGKKSDKNRKLYNGRLQCYYYQYYRED